MTNIIIVFVIVVVGDTSTIAVGFYGLVICLWWTVGRLRSISRLRPRKDGLLSFWLRSATVSGGFYCSAFFILSATTADCCFHPP